MATDEERREVARALMTEYGPCIDVLMGLWRRDGYDVEFALWLSRLIDRPTCRDLSDVAETFRCSACDAVLYVVEDVANEYGEAYGVPFAPRYCPSCGAEVER